jgi:hypothetical protein
MRQSQIFCIRFDGRNFELASSSNSSLAPAACAGQLSVSVSQCGTQDCKAGNVGPAGASACSKLQNLSPLLANCRRRIPSQPALPAGEDEDVC